MRVRRNLQLHTGHSYMVAPLIDVLFLLLIFFMISSSLVFEPGLTVELPEIPERFGGVANKMVIAMTREKLVFFNGSPVNDQKDKHRWEAELDRLVEEAARNPEPSQRPVIIIKADRNLPYNQIVKIMAITMKHRLDALLVTKTTEQ